MNCVPYPMSNQMHPKIHSVLIFLVYFLLPLVIISVYYYHIARTLMKSAHDMPGEVRDHTRRQVSLIQGEGQRSRAVGETREAFPTKTSIVSQSFLSSTLRPDQ